MNLKILKYDNSFESKWDDFVLNKSVNGTFLQTRNFLNYHPADRFEDASLLLMNGTNIIGVVPAHKTEDEGKITFFSHKGSTFGGIILSPLAYNVSTLEELIPALNSYLIEEGYEKAILKCTSDLFSSRSMGLLDYELFRFGYTQYDEVAFYIPFEKAPEDILSMMTSSKRRDCKYSLKNDFRLCKLNSDNEVAAFYRILEENLKKFDTVPVHTLEELLDFKNNRLSDTVMFYGVCDADQIVAGSMLFNFNNKILHTQYLACLPEYNRKFAMNYMDYELILQARALGYEAFSFGTSTTNRGKDLNVGLALYKEGFGCEYSVNRTYLREFS